MSKNDSLKKFDPNDTVTKVYLDKFKERLKKSYAGNKAVQKRIEAKLDLIVEKWVDMADHAINNNSNLYYVLRNNSKTNKGVPLMIRFEEKGNRARESFGWVTLQSMRHVDKEINLDI